MSTIGQTNSLGVILSLADGILYYTTLEPVEDMVVPESQPEGDSVAAGDVVKCSQAIDDVSQQSVDMFENEMSSDEMMEVKEEPRDL